MKYIITNEASVGRKGVAIHKVPTLDRASTDEYATVLCL